MTDHPGSEPKAPSAPRWVKVAAVAGGVLVAVILVTSLLGDGHGPGRHLPGGGDHVPVDHAP